MYDIVLISTNIEINCLHQTSYIPIFVCVVFFCLGTLPLRFSHLPCYLKFIVFFLHLISYRGLTALRLYTSFEIQVYLTDLKLT